MLKNLAPLFYTVAGVASAGGVGYVIVENSQPPSPPVEVVAPAPVQPEAKAPVVIQSEPEEKEQEVASLNKEDQAPAPEPIKPSIELPIFEVLRVEKDGSTVVAGKAAPESKVEIVNASDNNRVVGVGAALPSGDFAIVFEEPLAKGRHELYIISTLKDGNKLQSAEAGLIEVPGVDENREPMVIVSKLDAPTRVLQAPQTEVASLEPSINEETPAEDTKPAPSNETQDEVAAPETEVTKPEAPAVSQEVAEEPEKKTLKPILIQAADVENGKIFVAGVGEPGDSVNIYINEEFIGSTRIAENGSFLFEGDHQLEPGRHPIRADMVEPGKTEVLARAEVALLHEPQTVIAATEAPKTETASIDDNAEEAPQPPAAEEKNNEPETQELAEIRTGSSVIIRRGDSLWRVARRSYGAGIRFTTIFDANRDQVRNPDLIYPGQVLKIPEDNQTGNNNSAG